MLTAIGRAAAFRLPIRAAPLIVSRPQPIARAACRSFSTSQWSRLAAKAATTKKTAKKTSTVKEKAKKAASPKKKTEKTEKAKPGPKPKPKKALTAEQLEKIRKRAWKEQSLVASEPKSKPRTGWTVFLDEFLQARPGMSVPSVLPEASAEYRQLPSYEIQRLEKKAEENKRAWQVEWKAWLTSYTPQEIVAANNARSHLRKLKGKQIPAHLKDERIPKAPTTAFAGFIKARLATGELPGRANEHMKALSGEWNALSEDEKAPWLEMAEAEKARYSRDVREVLGREVHGKSKQ
ncbi:hypothetical protein CPLU01_03007 [Colletotrichum plurivorum]|uniref:HMG box domain-containing protein n=1 Tax=Colletotrichum plurivorum TaxID=2175906 RepID=A0A8H6KU02_9PEZI|nr:hypothetical protein CPLU01_03007 [Colletotrichum plurivorum]